MKQQYHPHGTGRYQPNRLHDLIYGSGTIQPVVGVCPRCGHKREIIQAKAGPTCEACWSKGVKAVRS